MVLRIADETGALKTVQRAWLFDGARFKAASCAWIADSTGVLKKEVDCIGAITTSASAVDHLNVKVIWSAPGATSVEIYIGNSKVHTATAASGNYTVPGRTPGSTIVIIVKAISANNTVESVPMTVVMPPMPAPTGLSHSGVTNTEYRMDWASVTGAGTYDVYNASNNAKLHSTSGTSWQRTGLTASTNYRTYVKSLHSSGAASAASSVLSTTTTARFTPGTFEFYPGSADTWQASGSWRGTGQDKLWHGDGGAFGASGGSRYACFFGHTRNGQTIQQFFASQGAVQVNVTKCEFYMYRIAAAHGIYGAQTCRWFLHQNASKPAGGPAISTGAYDSGSLALGQGGWFTMPLDWGVALMNGSHKGIVWGGYPYFSNGAGYMIAPTLNLNGAVGGVRITVG